MTRLVILVKSKFFKGHSIILNRQCYRSLCVDVMMLASLFCYLFIYLLVVLHLAVGIKCTKQHFFQVYMQEITLHGCIYFNQYNNENKTSMQTKIQFHFFIHIQSNNKLFILNIFKNF